MSNEIFKTSFDLDNEIKRFEMNEYIEKGKRAIELKKISPDDDDYDADDLLYTNAITDDVVGDKLDKSRYKQDKIRYLNVQSTIRTNNYFTFIDESLLSTGNTYVYTFTFYPFKSLYIDSYNSLIYFRLKSNFTGSTLQNINTGKDIFYINLDIGKRYTIDGLKTDIQSRINDVIYSNISDEDLQYATDPKNMFIVDVELNEDENDPNIVSIIIDIDPNYTYICQFSEGGQLNPINDYNNNNYTIILDSPIENVKSIRLISSNIKNSDTIINETNNLIKFSITNPDGSYNINNNWHYVIQCGDYTIDLLLTKIISELNSIITLKYPTITDYFKYTYDMITGIIEITSKNTYTNMFIIEFVYNPNLQWRNLLVMLGFKENINVYSNKITNGVLKIRKPQSRINNSNIELYGGKTGNILYKVPYMIPVLEKTTNIWIDLNSYQTLLDLNTDRWYFNKFSFFKGCEEQDGQPQNIVQIFENPIYLDRLNISLYDDVGFPYNTNSEDHWFIFEVIYETDRLYSTNISSKRDTYGGLHTTRPTF